MALKKTNAHYCTDLLSVIYVEVLYIQCKCTQILICLKCTLPLGFTLYRINVWMKPFFLLEIDRIQKGDNKKETEAYLDLFTTKNIKLKERVLIPVKQYPKVSFASVFFVSFCPSCCDPVVPLLILIYSAAWFQLQKAMGLLGSLKLLLKLDLYSPEYNYSRYSVF